MNQLNHFTMNAAKGLEVLFWIGLGVLVVALIASCVGLHIINGKIKEEGIDVRALVEQAATEGIENLDEDILPLVRLGLSDEDFIRADGTLNTATVVLALIAGMFNCAAFAMIFRNIHLIVKTAKGKTWFSQGETPFQKDITRMIREIGIFLFALCGAEFILSFFASFLTWNPAYLVIGVLMLCLSSFFHYGESLQQDSDVLI